ncbi:MAG: TIGR00269 family protein [Thermoplasmata archaeon]
MLKCDKCNNIAVISVRYSGAHLCKKHFNDFFERRVKKEIRQQCDLKKGSKIAVALSGGKDSTVAMHMVHKIFRERKDISIEAILVDEGIATYRPYSIKIAKKNCKSLDIPLHIVRFSDYIGKTMDEIVEHGKDIFPCTYCGVFRRSCLNKKAKEIGTSVLATGHNLDDTSQSIMMNLFKGDVEKLARLGPHNKIQKGLVPRIEPLRIIPEVETYLYALLNKIEIHGHEHCPYTAKAQRNEYRKILYDLEKTTPGTRHAIVSCYDQLRDILQKKYQPARLKTCKRCGEPTLQTYCKTCILKKEWGM